MARRVLLLAPLLVATVAVVCAGLGVRLSFGPRPGSDPRQSTPTGRVLVIESVEFVEIGPGWFQMGSNPDSDPDPGDLVGRTCVFPSLPWGRAGTSSNCVPIHWVEFPDAFWIARCEITNDQYERFDPKHQRDDHSPGDRDPAVSVDWQDAKSFCAWLGTRSGRVIRLPSEAEWEAACRAGSRSEFCFGDDEAGLGEYAWYGENSDLRAHEVGTRKANAWGLHDLHGNVWEWCEDPFRTPTAVASVVRGGSWVDDAPVCGSSPRIVWNPRVRTAILGFRPAMDATED